PLDEIALTTKISIKFLRALEEGRFEDLPGEVFIKGFLRSYSQAIGANIEEVMAAYHESSGQQEEAQPAAEIPESPAPEGSQSSRQKALAAAGVALLVLGIGVYWLTSDRSPRGTSSEDRSTAREEARVEPAPAEGPEAREEAAQAPVPEAEKAPGTAETPPEIPEAEPPPETVGPQAPEEAKAELPTPAQPVPEAPDTRPEKQPTEPIKNTVTVPEKDAIIKDLQDQSVPKPLEEQEVADVGDPSLSLVIQVNENAWFNLTVDGERDQDFILPAGGSKTVKATNEIVVTVGNRRATQLTLNDQLLDLPESPDNVIRNLTVNAELLN
nr:DUF4115 domain-containing protein [Nitrospinaceae bacterium]NIR56481.1 DUF4115 domain-containing protein [Nitrospinaceae bacterium]NIS86942.1 DUF4115 domain-containing protein [Nitrospinaceae bacterium]NIT83780.1 DUF4115 domain-containing protein [Nitrospinaceae bacterium]NIU45983.1 DUF4115 domain-containing protein [Nitrospinaceae bacterium]